jgi:hypothetical protein
MEHYSPEKINEVCADLSGKAYIAAVNAEFFKQDESHLFPIRGKFNVTRRAIRRVRAIRKHGCGPNDGLEYCLAIDAEISEIVNNEKNW